MDPDDAPSVHEPPKETGRFPSGAIATFDAILNCSDLVVEAVPAEPPWRELAIKCVEHVQDGQLRRIGPPLGTHVTRWRVTAIVAARPDGDTPPAIGSVIEVFTAQIDLIIDEHALYHRPGHQGMTISRAHSPPYSQGLPHDHVGEALLTLTCCRGWLTEHAPYHEVIDGGRLPVTRRSGIEARWPELHPSFPRPAPRAPRRWWWPW